MNEDEILTPSDVSKMLKIHLKTVYKLAHDGTIPGQRIGRSWRFRKSVIDKLIDGEEIDEAAA